MEIIGRVDSLQRTLPVDVQGFWFYGLVQGRTLGFKGA